MRNTMKLLGLVLLITVSTAFAESGMKSVIRENSNVRKGPGQSHAIFYKAPLGYPLKVERAQGDWMYCKDWEGDHGWIHRTLVGNLKTVVIQANKVNLRQGPAQTKPITEKAERGRIYKVLQSRNGWHQLAYYDSNDVVGWVRSDLVWGQ